MVKWKGPTCDQPIVGSISVCWRLAVILHYLAQWITSIAIWLRKQEKHLPGGFAETPLYCKGAGFTKISTFL